MELVPLGPMDALLICCGAVCLISCPIRFWKAWKHVDAVFNCVGGVADLIIGVLVVIIALFW